MSKTFIHFFVAILLLMVSADVRIVYRASVRELQELKNPFLQINQKEDKHSSCRTETINDVRNADFSTSCVVKYPNVTMLNIELRHHKKDKIDEHMGWAYIFTKNMQKVGFVTATVWKEKDNDYMGLIRIKVERVS